MGFEKVSFEKFLSNSCIELEAERIMTELHEGTFGTHSSGHTMAKKILREGYY